MKAKETLFEFYDSDEIGYMSSADDDKLKPYNKDDTRRPRLTLKHLNKLRSVREQKRLEKLNSLSDIRTMYQNSAE